MPLNQFFDLYPEAFRDHDEKDYMVLLLFLMYEKSKGHESELAPFIEAWSASDPGYTWSEAELLKSRDHYLAADCAEAKEVVDE